LASATTLLKTGDPAAVEAFKELAVTEPGDPEVQHGLGVAYLLSGHALQAREPLEQAMRFTRVPSRELVYNYALCRLLTRQDLEPAIEAVVRCLNVPAITPDETMLNLLGALLAQAGGDDTSDLVESARRLYARLDCQLENSRPGERRWGDRWMFNSDYDRLQQMRTKKVADYRAADNQAERARQQMSMMYAAPRGAPAKGKQQMTAQTDRQQWVAMIRKAETLRAEIPRPSWRLSRPLVPSLPSEPTAAVAASKRTPRADTDKSQSDAEREKDALFDFLATAQ
jgi:hypothetical protein